LGWTSYWSVPRYPLHVDGGPLIAFDREIGFVPTPNSSTTVTLEGGGSYHVYTDRRGARVSHPGEQSADKLDMLFIGDSFTWGHGVENDDTYAARVARGLHVSSANLALASYGTTQALQMLERNLDTRPSTVIYPVGRDHWRRNVSACAPTYYPFCVDYSYVAIGSDGSPEIRPPASNGVRRSALQAEYDREGLSPAQWLIHGVDVIRGRILLQAAKANAADARLQATAMEFLLSKMTATLRAIGASLIVVSLPARGQTSPAPEQLPQLSRKLGFRFLDVTPAMMNHGAANLYLPDGHTNQAGDALIADYIMKFLSDRD
jgi:hypothetical protein